MHVERRYGGGGADSSRVRVLPWFLDSRRVVILLSAGKLAS